MQPYKIFSLLAVIGLVAVFTFQNTQAVEVKLYFWSFSLSVSLLLLGTFAVGILFGMLLTFVQSVMRARRRDAAAPANNSYIGKDL
jgi:uncharacterized integral membrane protein